MKIRPVGAELFHTDRQTDRHDEREKSLFAILRKHLKTILKKSGTAESGSNVRVTLLIAPGQEGGWRRSARLAEVQLPPAQPSATPTKVGVVSIGH